MKKKETVDYADENALEQVLNFLKTIRKEVRDIHRSMQYSYKAVYTNQDLMDICGIGVKTLKKWRDCGDLPFSIKGNTYLYSRKDVAKFLERNHYDLSPEAMRKRERKS